MKKQVSKLTPVPMPSDWSKIHKILSEEWTKNKDKGIPKPPIPLILAGASFSSENEIRQRWIDLICWANKHDFYDLLNANLADPPDYDVAEKIAGVSDDGKGWWPNFGEQCHKPKIKPNKETVIDTLTSLKSKWAEIVGEDLATSTKPKKFSGNKSRRLVVLANPNFIPPWGNWYSANSNPKAFSNFRAAINNVIAPMEIDEITFQTEGWPKIRK